MADPYDNQTLMQTLLFCTFVFSVLIYEAKPNARGSGVEFGFSGSDSWAARLLVSKKSVQSGVQRQL